MKHVIRFLIFTFILTYLAHGLLAYATVTDRIEFGSFLGQSLFILGGSSPTIVGFLVVFMGKNRGVKDEFKKHLLTVKRPLGFWIFAIGTPLILGGVFQGIYRMGGLDGFSQGVPYYLFFVILFTSVVFGGIEELGWRGVLQEGVMKPGTPLVTIAVLIGVIWGFWHLPLFFIESVSHFEYAFLPFMFGAIMFSTYLTWLYVKTRSLLLVVLFHASINAAATIGLKLEFNHTLLTYAILFGFTIIGTSLLVMHEKYGRAVL